MRINGLGADSAKAVNIQAMGETVWSVVKDYTVKILNRPALSGLVFASGITLGVVAVWVIDRIFQKMREQLEIYSKDHYCKYEKRYLTNTVVSSPQEENFQNRLTMIYVSVLLIPGAAALAIKDISNFDKASFSFPLLTVGYAVGAKALEGYFKNSESRTEEFFHVLKKDSYHIAYHHNLDLSYYWVFLRYSNLLELGKIIRTRNDDSGIKKEWQNFDSKEFNSFHSLILKLCGLNNQDLKNLKEAGWFSLFSHIDFSNNTSLTADGILHIAQGGGAKLASLNLSGIDLTDDDLIQMALSGQFNRLQTLEIGKNPRITGKGIIQISKHGFEGLTMLDIGANPQLLGKGLDEWIEKVEFKGLHALGLGYSGIVENDLQQMIERAEWFRKLKGVDLSGNGRTLERVPPNINQMTQLNDKFSVRTIAYRFLHSMEFTGNGLFLRGCSYKFKANPELMALHKAHKVTIGWSGSH